MEEKKKSNIKLDKDKLDILYAEVLSCAKYAVEMQSCITRSYKADGSVLTKTDLEISSRIITKVKYLFPSCNIISEEEQTPYDCTAPYTFVLDPIDGTDVYSNGFPSFALALGILDNKRIPVGCMIVAPRFGRAKESLEIRLDPCGKLLIDNEIIKELDADKDVVKQITISSKSQKKINFDNYKGKVRTFGSTIIHIVCPVVFPFIQGCINQRAFIWDICASHAVLNHLGMSIVYKDGTPLTYTDKIIIDRDVCDMTLYCGTEKGIKDMMRALPEK
jgi:myo-inositol-1(or 4)-monophosphatase